MKAQVLSITTTLLLASAWNSFGQVGVSYPDTAPQRGVAPVGAYTFDKLETINKFNGNLTYSIPLTSMPLGRGGMTVPISLIYNSSLYDYTYYYTYSDQYAVHQTWLNQTLGADISGGWRLTARYSIYMESKPVAVSADYGGCTINTGMVRSSLLMPDGSRHVLHFPGFPQGFTGSGDGYFPWTYTGGPVCSNFSAITGTVDTFTVDGSYIRFSYNTSTGVGVATMPDGTTVTFPANGQTQTIADRNGNQVVDTLSYSTTTGASEVLSDFLGRTITIQTPLNGDGYVVTQAGFGGAPLKWTFGSAPSSNTTAFTFSYVCENTQSSGGISVTQQYCNATGGGGGIDQLQIPSDNSSSPLTYTFQYEPLTGLLQSVTLPSGASTTYSYQCNSFPACFDVRNDLLDPVVSKVVSWQDQSDGAAIQRTEKWAYGWTAPSGSNGGMTITRPDNGVEANYYYLVSGIANPAMPLVGRTVEPNGDAVDYYYQNNRPYGLAYGTPNPYVAAEIHSVAQGGTPSLSSITVYQTDKNGNRVGASTYDWSAYSTANRGAGGILTAAPSPAGTLLKQVNSVYTVSTKALAGTGNESISDDPNGYWNPAAPLFLHLLQSLTVSGAGPGSVSYYTYDGHGNPLSSAHWDSTKAATQPSPSNLNASNASVTKWTWDPTYTGNLTSETDPNGNVTTYSWDANNLYLYKKVQASNTPGLARTFTYGWDQSLGMLTSKTDVDNNLTTSYAYDGMGRQTQEIEASNVTGLARHTTTTYFDSARQVVVQKDEVKSGDSSTATGGLTKATSYDQLYRPTLTQDMETPTPLVTNPLPAGSGIKVQMRYVYSGNNSYKLVSNPFRAATSGAASGEQTMGWTLTTADQNGRVISSQSISGSGLPSVFGGSNGNSSGTVVTAYAVNPANATKVTDQGGNTSTTFVDGEGRLSGVTEAPGSLGYNTIYAYDVLDNLTCVNQNVSAIGGACSTTASHARSFYYDSLKRLQSATNPETGTIKYSYDGNGNLVSKTDNLGIITTYKIDALNRTSAKSYSDGKTATVQYTYGTVANPAGSFSIGQLVSIANADSTTNYSNFDALGRAQKSSQVTDGQTYTFGYNYNISSLVSEQYPSGRTVTTSYDGANRELGVSGSFSGTTTNYVGNVSYAVHGAPTSYQYGQVSGTTGKMVRTNGYNSRLQLSGFGDTNNASGLSYINATLNWGTTNNNGNLQGSTYVNGGTGLSFTQTYSYDGVDRLTSVIDTMTASGAVNYSRGFGYDPYGNMWVNASAGIAPMGNTPNSINSFTANNQLSGTSYDQAGNQTQVNGNTQTYDAENRQMSVAFAGASEAYVYDGNGKRVLKAGPSGTTVFVYDAMGRMAAEYSTATNNSPCTTCYLGADHLGTARLVTDGSGNVVARHDYLPFGEEIAANTAGRTSQWGAGNDTVNQKFTGKERDSESGLDYFGARYYGSALGRFTSADKPLTDQHPKEPQSWNLYTYVRSNPLASIDDVGRACSALNSKTGFCQRAELYANLDSLVGSKTRFFAAASAATQSLANVDVWGLGKAGANQQTRDFLEKVGQSLEKLNIETAGKILSGRITTSGATLDAEMVHKEQTQVQRELDSFAMANPSAYRTAIKEINAMLNPDQRSATQNILGVGDKLTVGATDKAMDEVLDQVRQSLGHDIDFANQADREAAGNALLEHIRNTNACDVAGSLASGCN